MSDDERDRIDRLTERMGAVESRLTVAEERAGDRARVLDGVALEQRTQSQALTRIESLVAARAEADAKRWSPMQLAALLGGVPAVIAAIAGLVSTFTGHPAPAPPNPVTAATVDVPVDAVASEPAAHR